MSVMSWINGDNKKREKVYKNLQYGNIYYKMTNINENAWRACAENVDNMECSMAFPIRYLTCMQRVLCKVYSLIKELQPEKGSKSLQFIGEVIVDIGVIVKKLVEQVNCIAEIKKLSQKLQKLKVSEFSSFHHEILKDNRSIKILNVWGKNLKELYDLWTNFEATIGVFTANFNSQMWQISQASSLSATKESHSVIVNLVQKHGWIYRDEFKKKTLRDQKLFDLSFKAVEVNNVQYCNIKNIKFGPKISLKFSSDITVKGIIEDLNSLKNLSGDRYSKNFKDLIDGAISNLEKLQQQQRQQQFEKLAEEIKIVQPESLAETNSKVEPIKNLGKLYKVKRKKVKKVHDKLSTDDFMLKIAEAKMPENSEKSSNPLEPVKIDDNSLDDKIALNPVIKDEKKEEILTDAQVPVDEPHGEIETEKDVPEELNDETQPIEEAHDSAPQILEDMDESSGEIVKYCNRVIDYSEEAIGLLGKVDEIVDKALEGLRAEGYEISCDIDGEVADNVESIYSNARDAYDEAYKFHEKLVEKYLLLPDEVIESVKSYYTEANNLFDDAGDKIDIYDDEDEDKNEEFSRAIKEKFNKIGGRHLELNESLDEAKENAKSLNGAWEAFIIARKVQEEEIKTLKIVQKLFAVNMIGQGIWESDIYSEYLNKILNLFECTKGTLVKAKEVSDGLKNFIQNEVIEIAKKSNQIMKDIKEEYSLSNVKAMMDQLRANLEELKTIKNDHSKAWSDLLQKVEVSYNAVLNYLREANDKLSGIIVEHSEKAVKTADEAIQFTKKADDAVNSILEGLQSEGWEISGEISTVLVKEAMQNHDDAVSKYNEALKVYELCKSSSAEGSSSVKTALGNIEEHINKAREMLEKLKKRKDDFVRAIDVKFERNKKRCQEVAKTLEGILSLSDSDEEVLKIAHEAEGGFEKIKKTIYKLRTALIIINKVFEDEACYDKYMNQVKEFLTEVEALISRSENIRTIYCKPQVNVPDGFDSINDSIKELKGMVLNNLSDAITYYTQIEEKLNNMKNLIDRREQTGDLNVKNSIESLKERLKEAMDSIAEIQAFILKLTGLKEKEASAQNILTNAKGLEYEAQKALFEATDFERNSKAKEAEEYVNSISKILKEVEEISQKTDNFKNDTEFSTQCCDKLASIINCIRKAKEDVETVSKNVAELIPKIENVSRVIDELKRINLPEQHPAKMYEENMETLRVIVENPKNLKKARYESFEEILNGTRAKLVAMYKSVFSIFRDTINQDNFKDAAKDSKVAQSMMKSIEEEGTIILDEARSLLDELKKIQEKAEQMKDTLADLSLDSDDEDSGSYDSTGEYSSSEEGSSEEYSDDELSSYDEDDNSDIEHSENDENSNGFSEE